MKAARQFTPQVEVQNAQRTVPIFLAELQRFAGVALMLACQQRRPQSPVQSLTTILVSLVSDARMARLHEQFCGIRGTTDVLTFHHGEIVLSAPMAVRQARLYRQSPGREMQLYILHGLLHLCGYDDTTSRAAQTMHRVQEHLFRRALEKVRSFERPAQRVIFRHTPAAPRGRTK